MYEDEVAIYIEVYKVYCQDIIVLVASKNCDKLIACTSVFAAVTESSAVQACKDERRLAGAQARLQMVLMDPVL